MRRISLALALVVSACIATATTQAATTHSLRHSHSIGLLTTAGRFSHVSSSIRWASRATAEPQSISHSRSRQTGSTLALPQSAYSPAVLNSQYNYSETPAFADTNWFASNHTQNSAGIYESFGMQYAWYQRADWSGTNPPTYFRYQGAKMSSATGAKNAWSDGIAFTSSQFGQTAQQCSNNTAVLSCEYIDYTYTNSGTQYSERYVAVQAGACYAEMTGTTTTSNISAASSTLVQILNQMAPAAVNAMNATCNPNTPPPPTAVPTATPRPTVPPAQTQFNVVAVRFEKNKKCDFSLKNNPVTQAKTGTKLYLRMYVNVASLGASSVGMTREYQLKLNGKKVFDQTFSDSITQNDTYCFYYPKTGYKVTKPGTYTFTAGAAMGGKVDAARAKLTVLQKYVAPKPVSFSLTNVSLASSTIHAGQQARVNVGFNVRNLKGTTNATITRTVLANLNGQWKGVSTNSSTTLVKNGQNSQSVTTQLNAPGHFEIQIAVTIGASTQRKTVGVTVA